MVSRALIFWGFIMFLSDATLGPPKLLGPFGVCWFGVDYPRRDDESCFDITGVQFYVQSRFLYFSIQIRLL